MADKELKSEIERMAGGARAVAVAYHDYETGTSAGFQGDRWFHAASTIKIPVLLGVFGAIESGMLTLDARVHVRNRFFSAADGSPYRVEASRDAGSEVQSYVGRTMKVRHLAKQMIVTSSNLATNLLVDLIGLDRLTETLEELGVEGIELHRGVEDEAAFAQGLNNRVTARGLVRVLRAIEEETISKESSREMLEIMHAQEFRAGIPSGLPDEARVANKTGEISTVAHDAGLVYLPGRKPYAVAILTEWDATNTTGRRDVLSDLSRAVYLELTSDERGDDA
ncbi:MAG TPA: serine hydrolase [Longimicrobiaceae bacterium]|nr:serine hydrolase [Longimicrobiaceae bacterium]